MAVLVNNIKLSPDADPGAVREQALLKLKKKESDVLSFRIVRQSIDARKKNIQLVYSAELTLREENRLPSHPDIRPLPPAEEPVPLKSSLKERPVVVGTGPCGLFAALTLARAGSPPLILERGAKVEKRADLVNRYWQGGTLDKNSNVQFGEGGAGTFSDGKLTTRINDARATQVLTEFHRFGAGQDILYKAKPHIGTDVLQRIIQNLRNYLIELGCEFQFETSLTDLCLENNALKGIVTSRGDFIPCSHLILAIGHSARDTYEMLLNRGVSMVQKPFSVGLRIEHLQAELDKALYGNFAGHPRLGAAEYQLSHRSGEDACYSFCMCPGGFVVAAASEPDSIVTNGMSYSGRDAKNANAALCVNVDHRYFDSHHPLAGICFQRQLEKMAFQMTQEKGAPMQTVGGFLQGKITTPGKILPSYTGQTVPSDLRKLFPGPITSMLQEGIAVFGKKIKGFDDSDALLTGPETRTSAPVRILRDEHAESISTKGFFPAGEGAGYAGGIVSAAVDGIRVAQAIITNNQGETK